MPNEQHVESGLTFDHHASVPFLSTTQRPANETQKQPYPWENRVIFICFASIPIGVIFMLLCAGKDSAVKYFGYNVPWILFAVSATSVTLVSSQKKTTTVSLTLFCFALWFFSALGGTLCVALDAIGLKHDMCQKTMYDEEDEPYTDYTFSACPMYPVFITGVSIIFAGQCLLFVPVCAELSRVSNDFDHKPPAHKNQPIEQEQQAPERITRTTIEMEHELDKLRKENERLNKKCQRLQQEVKELRDEQLEQKQQANETRQEQ